MSHHTTDMLSLLATVDAYLRTRISLYLDVDSLFTAEAAAQRQTREMLAELGFPGLMDGPSSIPVPTSQVEELEEIEELEELEDLEPVQTDSRSFVPNAEEVATESSEPEAIFGSDFDLLDEPTQLEIGDEPAASDDVADLDIEEVDIEDLEDLDLEEVDVEPVESDEFNASDFAELADEGDDDFADLGLEELDLDLPDASAKPVMAPFPSSFDEDAGDDETVLSTAPAPLEPMPVLDLEDEDVSDPATLGDPDETEDLLRESEPEISLDFEDTPLFDDEEDLISEPRELAEIEIEEPGEDALVTIEDTSDPRSDLEGLSRLSDSDLDDDPDTGNDEVIVRTTTPVEVEVAAGLSDSDFSPDDEETFVADLADIEKMKAKMANLEDTDDDKSENEVLLPPPEAPAPRLAAPRAAPAAAVAGVAGVAAGVAGVRAGGPQVTAGLYGNPSVPQIRDRNAPKPRAAAIQIDAAQEDAAAGHRGGAVLEEEELLPLGSSEDYGEEEVDVEPGSGGLSLDVQEYEEYEEEYEEEDDIELEEVEPEELAPVFDDSVDVAEVKRLVGEAEKAVEEGELELAIDLYSDVLDNDPENPEAHVRRGRLYLDYGDYSRAMSDFMLAEELAPDNPEPQIAVGDLYFARKDYSRAIGHFNDALKMDPNNAMAYCRRGISHYYRKRFAEALADLKQAEKLDDDIPNIRTYIAMAKKKAKR